MALRREPTATGIIAVDRNDYMKQYNLMNKDRLAAQKKANREKNIVKYRGYDLKRMYRIDVDGYNALYQQQDGFCRICGQHQSKFKKRLAVDHCHKTGKIRGLLCEHCNTGLGKFRDDPILLRNAAQYIENMQKSGEKHQKLMQGEINPCEDQHHNNSDNQAPENACSSSHDDTVSMILDLSQLQIKRF